MTKLTLVPPEQEPFSTITTETLPPAPPHFEDAILEAFTSTLSPKPRSVDIQVGLNQVGRSRTFFKLKYDLNVDTEYLGDFVGGILKDLKERQFEIGTVEMNAHHGLPERAQLSGRLIVSVRISEEMQEEIDSSVADSILAKNEGSN